MFLISSYLLRGGWQLKIVGNNKMFNSCDKLVVRFSNWDETNYRCTWIIGLLQLLTDYICIAATNDTNEAFVKMNHLGFCPHYTVWNKCHTSCASVSLIANKAISDESYKQKHTLYAPCECVLTLCKKLNSGVCRQERDIARGKMDPGSCFCDFKL